MKVGDLVVSFKGNLAIITGMESCGIYLDVYWCETGIHRTGLHRGNIRRVVKK